MRTHFTTDNAPGSKRLAVWQDIVCDVYVQLDCKSDMGSTFHGEITRTPLAGAACSNVSSDEQRVCRTPSRIARAREEFILIALGRDGAGAVLQDGRETVIRPGEFALYDTTRPYELRFNDRFTQTILQVPRKMLYRRIGNIEAMTAITFSSMHPVEKLAYDFIAGLAEAADRLEPDTAERLTDQALDLVALALSDRCRNAPLASSTHRAALLYRLKTYIRNHLHDPELSLSQAAAALGISTRYVNDLLADDHTSFQRHVLTQRLDQCARELASPRTVHRQIGEIAFAWGFNDLSHFGRVFREHYGLSPRDWRQSRLAS